MSKYDELQEIEDDAIINEMKWWIAIMLGVISVLILAIGTYFYATYPRSTDHIYRCNERYHAMKQAPLDLKLKADFSKNCNDPTY